MTNATATEHFTAPGVLRQTWIVSNRGPGEYRNEDGKTVLRWQPGGLAMVLIPPALHAAQTEQHASEVVWLAAAKTPQDVERANDGVLDSAGPNQPTFERPVQLRFLELSAVEERLYYGTFANTVLWMTHHGMEHDLTIAEVNEAWEVYKSVNRRFAEYVVEKAHDGAIVQVHDYQLALAGKMIRDLAHAQGKHLDVVGFWHISFAETPQILNGMREFATDCPKTSELLEAIGDIPMGFHRDQWVERFTGAHHALLGRAPTAAAFVMPAYVDVNNLRSEARRREVGHSLDAIRGELAQRNHGRGFTGKIIGAVGRADPKNGMDRLLDAYELLLEDDELVDKPALLMNVSPTRPDVELYRKHWDYLLQKSADIQRRFDSARILIRYNIGRNGKPNGKPRADAVATFRLADVLAVLSRAGGRDIVGQEAVALKVLTDGDKPSVAVLSAEAGTSDTLTGIVAEESRPTGWDPEGNIISRAITGEGFRPGAVVVRNIGPHVPEHTAAQRCAAALKQALLMNETEVMDRFAVMDELLALEDPDIWYGELMVRSQDHHDGEVRHYERGTFKETAYILAKPSKE